jgi:hypothetical protein
MGRGSYLGGSTLIRPWSTSWFGSGKPSAGAKKGAKAKPKPASTKPKSPTVPATRSERLSDKMQDAGLALLRMAEKPKAISRLEKVMLDRVKPQSAPPSPQKQKQQKQRAAAPAVTPPIADDEPYTTVQALDRALDAALAMAKVAKQRIARAASAKPRTLTPREAKSAQLVAEARAEAARKQAVAARRQQALARAAQVSAATTPKPALSEQCSVDEDVKG